MTVIDLPIPRAIDIPLWTVPAPRLARTLVTQYWRRAPMLLRPAVRPEALAVVDDGIVQALAGLKQHLVHAPGLEEDCRQAMAAAASEVLQPQAEVFALACLQALHLQQGQAREGLAAVLGTQLQEFPRPVFDALRFCLDARMGEYLAGLVAHVRRQPGAALADLLMRLAIARPAVSDGFADAAAAWVAPLPGGQAALCGWRCTGRGDEAKALAALEQDDGAQAALVALALMGSAQETPWAHRLLARAPDSGTALALLAARDGHALALSLREGRHPHMPWHQQAYAASLVGDIPLLHHLLAHADWNDETACRVAADAAALLTGAPADSAFDMALPADVRAGGVDAALAALPLDGPPLRLGRERAQVTLQDAMALVGAPLRHLLCVEHTSRVGGALWIEADDLASVQALACTTAAMIERAAYRMGGTSA
jgi:hypothetical protein